MLEVACSDSLPSLPICMLQVPNRRHTPSGQTPDNLCGLGLVSTLPIRTESGHTWCATLSIWLHAGQKALDPQEVAAVVGMVSVVMMEEGCLLHQCLLEWALPAPGVAGDGA